MSLLGYERVHAAAQYTSGQAATRAIHSRYCYLVGVLNRSTARATYLYTLLHCIELAMRSRLDLTLTAQYESLWHLHDPPVYADPIVLRRLWGEAAAREEATQAEGWVSGDRPRLRWRQDPVTTTMLPDYESPTEFLEDVEFRTLTKMVLHTYETRTRESLPVLVTQKGDLMPIQSAKSDLKFAADLRNAIAHNRPPRLDRSGDLVIDGSGEYGKVAKRIERLLKAFEYSMDHALANIELEHMNVVHQALARHGGPGLAEAIAVSRAQQK